jgi:hypothetical protein
MNPALLMDGLSWDTGWPACGNIRGMLSPEDETRAITEVIHRLTASHPDLAPDFVQHTVRTSHERFDGSPIRDFVPMLVERMAKTSIAQSPMF